MTASIERQGQQWPHRVAELHEAAPRLGGGGRIRVHIAMPMPTDLQLSNEQPEYSGSHGMKVYQDEQGDWSFKQPKPSLAFTVPLEAAAATLQRNMGVEAPESYAITHNGAPAVVSKWYPGSTQAWQKPPRLAELSPEDQMTIQKNHVLDWLIGNHDSHVGNWMRTQDGKLVSIDKGQAGKYFGHDRLDPTFHPNYYAREPIYNQLYRDHAAGLGQMHDPRTGELGQFVQQVQSIPDEDLKNLFRPYAESAAKSGLLLSPDGDPSRKLGPRTVPANDPEAFLSALVDRKNNLHRDLGDYHDRMSGVGQQRIGRGRGPHRQGPNPRFRPLNRPYYEQRVPIGLHQGDGGELEDYENEPNPFDPRSFTAAPRKKRNRSPELLPFSRPYDYLDSSPFSHDDLDPDFVPGKEGWMHNSEGKQLDFEPWQNGEIRRPNRGNQDPNFLQNNGYIPYGSANPPPGPLVNSEGTVRHWWEETPESLADWHHQYERQPGAGQMDLFGGPDTEAFPRWMTEKEFDDWRYSNVKTADADPGTARGDRLYLPGDVADHLGVPRQTLMSWIYNNETPTPTHTSKPHKEMWDNLDVWNKWYNRRKSIKPGPRGYPEGWSDEFKNRKDPQHMYTIPEISQQTGMSLGDVYKSIYRPQSTSVKLPRNTHYAIGDDKRGIHFWDSLKPLQSRTAATNGDSLSDFIMWCAHNHKQADRTTLSEYAAISGMDPENYLDLYLFIANSDGIFREGGIRQAIRSGKQVYTVQNVADLLGVHPATMKRFYHRDEIPTPSHFSGRHKALWDDLRPWEKWHKKLQALNVSQGRKYPEGWADEFKHDEPPKKLHSMKEIAAILGRHRSSPLKWFSSETIRSKPPQSSHYVEGFGHHNAMLWDDITPMLEWFKSFDNGMVKNEKGGLDESLAQHDRLQKEMPAPMKPWLDQGEQAKVLDDPHVLPLQNTMPKDRPQSSICPDCFTQHKGECW